MKQGHEQLGHGKAGQVVDSEVELKALSCSLQGMPHNTGLIDENMNP